MTLPTSGLITVNNRGARAATTFGSVAAVGGNMVFIKKLTGDGSGTTLSFLNGSSDVVFDSTYKEYVFTFKNIHPATDEADLTFQADTGTNTNYNTAITSTSFRAFNRENDSSTGFGYRTADDQAQGTAFQKLIHQLSDDNDHGGAGILHIFNPSSTTFVKHFIFTGQHSGLGLFSRQWNVAGYFNTTTALTRVQFKMSSGNIDAGDICLYGIL